MCLLKVAKICAMSSEGWNEVMDHKLSHSLSILFQDPFHSLAPASLDGKKTLKRQCLFCSC